MIREEARWRQKLEQMRRVVGQRYTQIQITDITSWNRINCVNSSLSDHISTVKQIRLRPYLQAPALYLLSKFLKPAVFYESSCTPVNSADFQLASV